jgi:uncharacterized iron-regulated membrane protein
MTKKLKKAIRQVHLWLGLGTGLIVFIISITGLLYVFEEEIRDFSDREYLHVSSSNAPFIGLDSIIRNFEKVAPKEKLTAIKITENEPGATVQLSSKGKKVYYFDPYNGSLVNQRYSDWLNTVLEIHTSLLMGDVGKVIQGWSVVIFLLMLLSGLVLWFPSQMRLLRQSLTVKWKGSKKRVNYDLHSVLGFYAAIFLIVIGFTGTYFAFKGVKSFAGFITGSQLSNGSKSVLYKPVPAVSIAEKYNGIYKSMSIAYPGAISVLFSIRKTGELRLRMTYPYQWGRKQNTFFFNQDSAELLRAKLYRDNNTADEIEAINYEVHTGRIFGIFGKIIWSIVSLISASLPVTGFIIWWNKRKWPAAFR